MELDCIVITIVLFAYFIVLGARGLWIAVYNLEILNLQYSLYSLKSYF
jgi:hypothetical protein